MTRDVNLKLPLVTGQSHITLSGQTFKANYNAVLKIENITSNQFTD